MAMLSEVSIEPEAFSPAPFSEAESAAMLRACVQLFARWGLTDAQAGVLLDVPPTTWRRWKTGAPGRIGRDGQARLSNLLGIHKALRLIFVEPERGYRWVRAANAAFDGRSALDVMLDGDLVDLMRVRRYLDAERGAW
jgi:hypothetical protein